LLAQRNEAKKVPHESQPKAFLGARAALLCPENFPFAPLVLTFCFFFVREKEGDLYRLLK
jgi:hypothetical protein